MYTSRAKACSQTGPEPSRGPRPVPPRRLQPVTRGGVSRPAPPGGRCSPPAARRVPGEPLRSGRPLGKTPVPHSPAAGGRSCRRTAALFVRRPTVLLGFYTEFCASVSGPGRPADGEWIGLAGCRMTARSRSFGYTDRRKGARRGGAEGRRGRGPIESSEVKGLERAWASKNPSATGSRLPSPASGPGLDRARASPPSARRARRLARPRPGSLAANLRRLGVIPFWVRRPAPRPTPRLPETRKAPKG